MTFVLGVQLPGCALLASDQRQYTVDQESGDVLAVRDGVNKIRRLPWGFAVSGGSREWGDVMLDLLDADTFAAAVAQLQREAPERMPAAWDDPARVKVLQGTYVYAAVREPDTGAAYALSWDGTPAHTFRPLEPAACCPLGCDVAFFRQQLATCERTIRVTGGDGRAMHAVRACHAAVRERLGPQGTVGPDLLFAVVGRASDEPDRVGRLRPLAEVTP